MSLGLGMGIATQVYYYRTTINFVYYESLKREVKTKPIYEFRCDERLKTKVEESTRLVYTRCLFIMKRLSEN